MTTGFDLDPEWEDEDDPEWCEDDDDNLGSALAPGCLYPGECVMADPYHLSCECATAEMMEEYYRQAEEEDDA